MNVLYVSHISFVFSGTMHSFIVVRPCLILSTTHIGKDYCGFEFIFLLKILMYTNALLACVRVHYLYPWYPRRPEGIGSSGTGYEPPTGCRESNLGPLEDKPVLLPTELTLQLSSFAFNLYVCV